MEGLLTTVERLYGVKVDAYEQVRAVYKIITDRGALCLKPSTRRPEKILYMQQAMEHLQLNGFTQLAPILTTLHGKGFFLHEEQPYLLSQWIEGRECDFEDWGQAQAASALLAKLHQASKGFVPTLTATSRELLGSWPKRWQKALKELGELRHKSDLPQDFLEYYREVYPFYCQQATLALDLLNLGMYHKHCLLQSECQGFCHRDYTWHNLIFSPVEQLFVVDFDYVGQDLFMADLGRFAERVLRVNSWSIQLGKQLLTTYREGLACEPQNLVLLLAYLFFPQRFYRYIMRYLAKEQLCSPNYKNYCLDQLHNLYAYEAHRQEFLHWLAGEIGLSLGRGRV